ncbi:hypothetical protein Hanom_Chr10g00905751 [Helianthus anomalus]
MVGTLMTKTIFLIYNPMHDDSQQPVHDLHTFFVCVLLSNYATLWYRPITQYIGSQAKFGF